MPDAAKKPCARVARSRAYRSMMPPATKSHSSDVHAGRADDDDGTRRVVEKRAEVVEDSAEADDRRPERRRRGRSPGRRTPASSRSSRRCAAVSAARLPPRCCASMPRSAERQRQADASVISHTPARIAGARLTRRMPSSAGPNSPFIRRNAHDSRQSCSQTIHFERPFVAAAGPRGRSVFELFV